jgi:hypothetical protein
MFAPAQRCSLSDVTVTVRTRGVEPQALNRVCGLDVDTEVVGGLQRVVRQIPRLRTSMESVATGPSNVSFQCL